MEVFGGGWWSSHYVSWQEIEEMKKNMKKVPKIQEKSHKYQEEEIRKAEKELEKQTEILKINKNIIIDEEENIEKMSLRQKSVGWFKRIFIKK